VGLEVFAVMRLVSRAVHPLLVCVALALVVQASPCCDPPTLPSTPVLRVLVPDTAAGRWYYCRGVAEEDLGVVIALSVMPTSQEWAEPPRHPIEIMREVVYDMIAEDSLPDMAMLPRELAQEISDRCYVYDLDVYRCWVEHPFLHDGVIDGVILPWASDLVLVFFEPGEHVLLGLSLLSHPVLASMRPPSGCCDWPPTPKEPEPFCCP